ncbi:hypothetical protein CPC08DRAFT_806310 [Agrocybe pediades]|nr:hypothetical protein CPC08DRAFT_806310 [Agrocybe pediades]
MHERAALACFKELARKVPLLPSPSEKNTVIATIITSAEDDTHPELIFNESANGAQWQFKGPWNFKLEDEDLYFILLGYVIFLLPRCGWLDTLVAACKVYGTYIAYAGYNPRRCLLVVRAKRKPCNLSGLRQSLVSTGIRLIDVITVGWIWENLPGPVQLLPPIIPLSHIRFPSNPSFTSSSSSSNSSSTLNFLAAVHDNARHTTATQHSDRQLQSASVELSVAVGVGNVA